MATSSQVTIQLSILRFFDESSLSTKFVYGPSATVSEIKERLSNPEFGIGIPPEAQLLLTEDGIALQDSDELSQVLEKNGGSPFSPIMIRRASEVPNPVPNVFLFDLRHTVGSFSPVESAVLENFLRSREQAFSMPSSPISDYSSLTTADLSQQELAAFIDRLLHYQSELTTIFNLASQRRKLLRHYICFCDIHIDALNAAARHLFRNFENFASSLAHLQLYLENSAHHAELLRNFQFPCSSPSPTSSSSSSSSSSPSSSSSSSSSSSYIPSSYPSTLAFPVAIPLLRESFWNQPVANKHLGEYVQDILDSRKQNYIGELEQLRMTFREISPQYVLSQLASSDSAHLEDVSRTANNGLFLYQWTTRQKFELELRRTIHGLREMKTKLSETAERIENARNALQNRTELSSSDLLSMKNDTQEFVALQRQETSSELIFAQFKVTIEGLSRYFLSQVRYFSNTNFALVQSYGQLVVGPTQAASRLAKFLATCQRIKENPEALKLQYEQCLVEISRRRAWQQSMCNCIRALGSQIAANRENEFHFRIQFRQVWGKSVLKYFPDLFENLNSNPGQLIPEVWQKLASAEGLDPYSPSIDSPHQLSQFVSHLYHEGFSLSSWKSRADLQKEVLQLWNRYNHLKTARDARAYSVCLQTARARIQKQLDTTQLAEERDEKNAITTKRSRDKEAIDSLEARLQTLAEQGDESFRIIQRSLGGSIASQSSTVNPTSDPTTSLLIERNTLREKRIAAEQRNSMLRDQLKSLQQANEITQHRLAQGRTRLANAHDLRDFYSRLETGIRSVNPNLIPSSSSISPSSSSFPSSSSSASSPPPSSSSPSLPPSSSSSPSSSSPSSSSPSSSSPSSPSSSPSSPSSSPSDIPLNLISEIRQIQFKNALLEALRLSKESPRTLPKPLPNESLPPVFFFQPQKSSFFRATHAGRMFSTDEFSLDPSQIAAISSIPKQRVLGKHVWCEENVIIADLLSE